LPRSAYLSSNRSARVKFYSETKKSACETVSPQAICSDYERIDDERIQEEVRFYHHSRSSSLNPLPIRVAEQLVQPGCPTRQIKEQTKRDGVEIVIVFVFKSKSPSFHQAILNQHSSIPRRRGWDSNPRWAQGPQRFSRPPQSATLAPLRIRLKRHVSSVTC
jgi:hypothetical protein